MTGMYGETQVHADKEVLHVTIHESHERASGLSSCMLVGRALKSEQLRDGAPLSSRNLLLTPNGIYFMCLFLSEQMLEQVFESSEMFRKFKTCLKN